MLINRNVVLKREGNKLLFPTLQHKEVDVPANTPNYLFVMCRIVSYDQNSGTLDLMSSREHVGDTQYRISIEVNSEILSPLPINRVCFVNPPHRYITLPKPSSPISYTELKAYQEPELRRVITIDPELEKERREAFEQKTPFKYEIAVSVKDIMFLDGKVTFEYFIIPIGRNISFDISNSFLKKEFDSIKNYFPKALKINKFIILIEGECQDGKILNSTCSSSQISSINESLFELVQDLYISDHISNAGHDEIFNLDDLVLELIKIGSEDTQDKEWVLNKLIAPNRTKHYYHLRYLSDKHSSNTINLKLTGKPLSFIFLLEISNGFCLIWETYETEEATYVWKIVNCSIDNLSSTLQEHIERIKYLRRNNKNSYLRTKPENFIRIEHDYSGEDNGFKKWKSKLEAFILKTDEKWHSTGSN